MGDLPERDENSNEDEVLQQQFMRAVSSFEGIILSQIDIKNRLANRLNYSITAGLVILGLVAGSILILLLTLSSQINRISEVVSGMNQDFTTVSEQMHSISQHVSSMESQVARMSSIRQQTASMDKEVLRIAGDLEQMQTHVDNIGAHMNIIRGDTEQISGAMNQLDGQMRLLGGEMYRMSRPARTINKFFPIP